MQPDVSAHSRCALRAFQLLVTEPERYHSPQDIDRWQDALVCQVPETIASALGRAGKLDESNPLDLDAHDAWLRTRLPDALPSGAHHLVFEGLATTCDVWLEGEHVLRTETMYRRHTLYSARPLAPGMELVLRFSALRSLLSLRRTRPRFRTRLVDAQQLRFVRTSLFGRMPGIGPRLPIVGAYRSIYAEARPRFDLHTHALKTRVVHGRAQIELTLGLSIEPSTELSAALVLQGEAAEGRFPLSLVREAGGVRLYGCFSLEAARLWWPHTHGAQPLCDARVELTFAERNERSTISFGKVGFRALEVDRGRDGDGFRLSVNGAFVFCRGAVWTPPDPLGFSEERTVQTLSRARAAGINMLRVPGIMLYESAAFFAACDALGILVFQDFMFANMDYPEDDERFLAEVSREATEQLRAWSTHPCLSVLCGGSEVEQQAAMLGLSPALGKSPLFYRLLPELCRAELPEVPYVPNSPSGGALPFQVDAGIAHYYGVGAYLRPLHDARLSRVRFAAECLAFANVPRTAAVEALLSDLEMPFHHPRWKERVPRDRGAGWDFEDVRDHYLELLYGASARELRARDPERYLAWSRAVVVDVMEATLSEFRSSPDCGGALVLWLSDVWLGAGFGVIDAHGAPKSAYYALRRAFAPTALFLRDEGMNGPVLEIVHDGVESFAAELRVRLYRGGETCVAEAEQQLEVGARATLRLRVDALFERFVDAGYVYRFGPAQHDLICAELRGAPLQDPLLAFALPLGSRVQECEPLGLSAHFEARGGRAGLALKTDKFARRIAIELSEPALVPEDNFFSLPPRSEHWVALSRLDSGAPVEDVPARCRASLWALNQRAPIAVSSAGGPA